MDVFRLNWFLGALAIEFWASAVLVSFGPELWALYQRRQAWRRAMRSYRRSEALRAASAPARLIDLQMRVGGAQQH